MNHWLLLPPVAFLVVLAFSWLLFRVCRGLAFRPEKHTTGERASYACGEENYDHSAQPDYSLFFPFAFFFTLAHVATLIMTTVPMETLSTFVLAVFYILCAILGLMILFRR